MKSVGFKEWAIVCQALGDGRQNVILRKGGIAEGRDGFAFRHREFFLFPTFFHEQAEKTRLDNARLLSPDESKVEFRFFAKVECACRIESWDKAAAMQPFHILQESVVRERFNDNRALGIYVAFLRVFRIEPAWILPNEKSYGGCRSWVELPDLPANMKFEPALSDTQHGEIQERFLAVINQGRPTSKSPIGGLETAAR